MNLSEIEKKILEFWRKKNIFEKSLRKKEASLLSVAKKSKKNFVFLEGPPTANGRPGMHHVEARAFKDIIPRYKTMRGFFVDRKAGWDTHGLPVELEVEKQLGLKNKKEIEKYGIGKFNQKCRESVWKYKDEWEKLTERIGFWLDMKNPYITYENYYIESLWFILKKIWDKGLMYKGFKVVPHCPRCVTTLSSHEVAQGYKTIKENSIYVKFLVKGEKNTFFLVWTTTPWTLPANVALAVGEDIDYVLISLMTHDGRVELRLAGEMSASGKYSQLVPGSKKIEEIYVSEAYLRQLQENDPKFSPRVLKKIKGKELIGLKYEPLFKNSSHIPSEARNQGSANEVSGFFKETDFRVVAGDFISTDEGTGIVHLAPAYGEDDLRVGQKENLSVVHTVDQEGIVLSGYDIPGQGKFIKEADKDIVESLKKRNLLFSEKVYEHEYPFCWRCDSPLLYYAKDSWFIKMSGLRNRLIANNKKINWEPAYIKDGRFGEFIKEAKDWAISRERFWGTPLPVWQCEKCGKAGAIGSVEEIKSKAVKSGNKYFVMRHGEAENNVKHILNGDIKNNHFSLTEKGERQAVASAKKLKKEKIDLIFSSDFLRTKETAELVAETAGFDKRNIIFDKRLRELIFGSLDGKDYSQYHNYFSYPEEKFSKNLPQGENFDEVKKRVMGFLQEMEEKFQKKNILIVTHDSPACMLFTGTNGLTNEEAIGSYYKKRDFIETSKFAKLEFVFLPHDENYVLDLHRPFVDKIKLKCECGGEMEHVKEVIDVWFDSGAMPFAQWGYPYLRGSNKEFKAHYPADYISEAIDQTRGWFYTLLAVATLMEECGVAKEGASYKNVICLGHVLDKFGKKMSKSRDNVVDPWEICDKFGADTVRWYFYTVNQAGDPKKFDIKDLQDKNRRIFGTLYNSLVFFQTYADKSFKPKNIKLAASRPVIVSQLNKPKNILDKWIISVFNSTGERAINYLEKYDIISAARLVEDFINDLSNWYIRRSRERFQRPKSKTEKEEASQTLYFILIELAKLIAPFAPFIAEEIYQNLKEKTDRESVHLCDYPKPNKKLVNKRLEDNMKLAREIVAKGLALRMEKKIKVRQPLLELGIRKELVPHKREQESGKNKELLELIKDEVNVKSVVVNKTQKEEVILNVEITPELKEEGMAREIVRQIQSMRKEAGLVPQDVIDMRFRIYDFKPVATLPVIAPQLRRFKNMMQKWSDFIKKETNAKIFAEIGAKEKFDLEKEINLEGEKIKIGIRKLK